MTCTVPGFLEGTPFEQGFRYWLGASGRHYLTRALSPGQIGDFAGAPVVLAVVDSHDVRRPVWVGLAATEAFDRAVAARQCCALEAHLHLLGADAASCRMAVADLAAGLGLAPGAEPSDERVRCGIAA